MILTLWKIYDAGRHSALLCMRMAIVAGDVDLEPEIFVCYDRPTTAQDYTAHFDPTYTVYAARTLLSVASDADMRHWGTTPAEPGKSYRAADVCLMFATIDELELTIPLLLQDVQANVVIQGFDLSDLTVQLEDPLPTTDQDQAMYFNEPFSSSSSSSSSSGSSSSSSSSSSRSSTSSISSSSSSSSSSSFVPNELIIKDYADGLFEIPPCLCEVTDDYLPWDGSFSEVYGESLYVRTEMPGGSIVEQLLLSSIEEHHSIQLSDGAWIMQIYCSGQGIEFLVWRGAKEGDGSPEGVYSRIDGLSDLPELEIED